jgi:hypothetical protein
LVLRIFVAHPFKNLPLPDYRDAFNSVVAQFHAKHGVAAQFEFADEQRQTTTDHILDIIKELIASLDAMIGNLTGGNANVALELGLAHGLGVTNQLLTKHKADLIAVPSDVQGLQYRSYDTRRELEAILTSFVESLFDLEEPLRSYDYHVGAIELGLFRTIAEAGEPLKVGEIAAAAGISQDVAQLILTRLIAQDQVVMTGGEGRGTTYELVDD